MSAQRKNAALAGFSGLAPEVRLSLAVLSTRLSARSPGVPRYFFLGITGRCQLNCGHCRYRQPGSARPGKDIATSAAARIFSSAAAAGVPRVILFGGEPALHPRLRRIVALASGAGLFTEMDTNGLALRRKGFLASLRRAGLCAVRVSLHSPARGEHDSLAGKGSFDAAVEAIRLARREGLLTYVSSCVPSDRTGSAAELASFAVKTGAHGLRMLPYAGPGTTPDLPLRLSRELKRSTPSGYASTCVPSGSRRCAALSGESLYIDNAGGAWTCPFSGRSLGRADTPGVFGPSRRAGRAGRYPCAPARSAGRPFLVE